MHSCEVIVKFSDSVWLAIKITENVAMCVVSLVLIERKGQIAKESRRRVNRERER